MSTWLGHVVPRYLVKDYFWVCLWWCFWMRLVFELVDWIKQTDLPDVGGYHTMHWELNRTKQVKEGQFPLSPWAGTSIYSRPQTPVLPVLRPPDLDWVIPPAALTLQINLTWASSHNKSPLVYLYISYWFCFSGEPWPIQSIKIVIINGYDCVEKHCCKGINYCLSSSLDSSVL